MHEMKKLFTVAYLLPFFLGLISVSTSYAQLAVGDIAIIASNHDGGDDIAFVALTDIPANQVIYFTDNEWDGSAFNDLNEGEITWTNDNSILSAGSVVVFTDISGSYSTNVGSLSGSNFNLGSSNEWFYALTSAPATSYASTPTFLAAFASDAGSGWLTNTGLAEGSSAVDFNNDHDGFKYTGSTSGEASFSDYLTLIYNSSNWQDETSNGENILPISTTAFTTSGGGSANAPSSVQIVEASSDKFNISWTKPSGTFGTDWDGVLVFVSDGASGIDLSATGEDGEDYTANLTYGSGTFATDASVTDNAYCVANQTTDADGDIIVTGLTEGTTYYVYAYGYAEVVGNNDDDSFSSEVDGGNASADLTTHSGAGTSAGDAEVTVSWTNPTTTQGTYWDRVVIVAREGSAVESSVSAANLDNLLDGSGVTANSDWSARSNSNDMYDETSTLVGADNTNYIVYSGTGTSVTVTGLTNGTAYHFRVFTYYTEDDGDENWAGASDVDNTPVAATPDGLQITSTNTAFTIDFDNTVSGVNEGAYDGSGLSTSPSSGQLDADSWEIDGFSGSQSFGVDNTSGDYARGSNSGGSTSTGGLYAFDVGSSNFALGVQPAGSDFTPGTIALRTQNATGASATTWRVSYTIYVYNDQGRSTSWNLSYSTDNSSYTNLSNLDFTTTESSDGGGWKSYRHVVEFSQSVASAGDLYLRWSSDDAGGSGSRDEIAIDDIEVIANPSGNVSLNGLTYDGYTISNATAEVTSGTFTINENITNNGTINVSSGASLYQTASTDGNSGSGTYNISRSTGTLVDDTRFQYWSSSVNNTTMGTVFTGSNTVDFYFFDESSGAWASQGSGSTMTPGRGYATTGTIGITSNSETRTFSGTVNNGDVSLSTTGVASSDAILVGNPYPSAISSATFVSDNTDLNGTLYFWNHSTAESGGSNTDADYATWNGVGSTGGNSAEAPDDYISSGQGFFVEASSANPTVSFNNDQRTSGNNTQFFKQGVEQRKRVWLSLSNDSNDVNQLLVGYLPQATEGVDRMYDGHKFKGHPRISFYSMIEEDAYSIQGLPDVGLEQTSIVPLGVDAWITGSYTIHMDSTNNWPESYSLQLEDRLEGTMTNLLTTADYSFTLDSIGEVSERFYLHVKHKLSAADEQPVDGGGNESPGSEGGDITGIEDADVTPAKVYRSGGVLVIESGDEIVEQVSVHDLSGRLCHEQTVSGSITNIPWNKTGMFIVSVKTTDHKLQRTKVNF